MAAKAYYTYLAWLVTVVVPLSKGVRVYKAYYVAFNIHILVGSSCDDNYMAAGAWGHKGIHGYNECK